MHQKVPVLLLHPPIVPLSEDSILNTAARIGGQPHVLIRLKGGDALDQPYGANGNQIVLVSGLGVILLRRLKQKEEFPR